MLLKNTAIYTIGELAGRMGKLLSLYLIALLMSKSEFGTYAFIISASLVLITLFDFGDNTLVVLRLTRAKFSRLLPFFYLAKFTTTLSSSLLLLIIYLIVGPVGGLYPALLPSFLAYCVGQDLQSFLGNVQRSRIDFAGEMWSKLVANFGFLIVLIAIIFLKTKISVAAALWIQTSAFLAGAMFSYVRIRPFLKRTLPPWRHARRGLKAILFIGAPMTLAASVGVLQASIDSLVLGGGSYLDANASFTITQRMAQMTYLPLGILVAVALPYLTEGLKGGRRSMDPNIINKSMTAIVLAATAVGQLFVLAGEWIIPLALGRRYADVAQYSEVLALYIIPIYIFPVLTGLLWVMRAVVATQSLYGVSTVMSLVLDILAIHHFGPFAVVWVAVFMNWMILFGFVGLYRLRIKSWPLRWPTLLMAFAGTLSIAAPRLAWHGQSLVEFAARTAIALTALTALSALAWRRRDFIRNLAMHKGAQPPEMLHKTARDAYGDSTNPTSSAIEPPAAESHSVDTRGQSEKA